MIMNEVRNLDGRLVCRLDVTTGMVEIKIKDCTTLIRRLPNGKIDVINLKGKVA
jgi:hypothetical protein